MYHLRYFNNRGGQPENEAIVANIHSAVFGTAVVGLLCLGGAGAGAQQQPTQIKIVNDLGHSDASVFDTLSSDPRFVTTMQMVYVAGASTRMQLANNVTVFAATNEAWGQSSYGGLLGSLTSTGASGEFPEPMKILGLLRGTVVRGNPGLLASTDVKMQSVAGRAIDVDEAAKTVTWTDRSGDQHLVHMSGPPIIAANGTIIPIDGVIGS